MPHLVVIGYEYSARRVGRRLMERGWRVTGTTRSGERAARLGREDVEAVVFDGSRPSAALGDALRSATHLLVSAPPDGEGDPLLRHHREDLRRADDLAWIGYLSTTGVYGDREGTLVDEETRPAPATERSRRRLDTEGQWGQLAGQAGVPLQIFRLAGIYGPGRSVLDRLRQGTARRLTRPGLVFNRIHVEDVAGAVIAGIERPGRTGLFNVSDDLPTPPAEVVEYGAELLGVDPPPSSSVEDADLSPAARSFYEENKRVDNRRLTEALGYRLVHPTYRSGLAAIAAEEDRS